MSKNIQKVAPTPIAKSSFAKNTKVSNTKDSKNKTIKENNFKEFSEDSDFFEDFTPYQRAGRIIHQSTEQSYDNKGNKVTKTKIVREIQDSSNKKTTQEIKLSTNKIQSKIESTKSKQKDIYSSPNFQSSPIYESPLIYNSNSNTVIFL